MPNLLSKFIGLPEASSGRRPQMLEFQGVNYNSVQAQDLRAFFPMWEGVGTPCFDLGPAQLQGKAVNILRSQDPYFGDVYVGDGTVRYYAIPNPQYLNFGLGPTPFSLSFWANTPGPAPALDRYLFSFDDPGQTNFPGYAVSFDTSGQVSLTTSNTTEPSNGLKTKFNPFDGQWHFYCCSHVPNPGTTSASTTTWFVDGQFDSTVNNIPYVGPVGTTQPLYLGIDDDGATGVFNGSFCDLRIYGAALGAQQVAQLYHPDTRWELYQPARKTTYFLPQPPPPPAFTPHNLTTLGCGA